MSTTDDTPAALRWPEDAEKSVLGALLLDNQAWDQVGDVLLPEHFYAHAHRLAYTAIGSMIVANQPADVLTVYEELARRGSAEEDVGGLPYLNELARSVPGASNVRRYAEIVAEHSLMRATMAAASRVQEILTAPAQTTLPDRLNSVVELFQSLAVHRARSEPRHIGEATMRMVDRISELADGRREPGIATRIPGFDRFLSGGLKPGRQVVIAARPSIGKSSLALAILLNVAAQGHPCGYLSMEMEEDEIVDRAAANLGQIDLEHIATGRLEREEWAELTRAVDELHQLPLYIDDQSGLSLAEVQAKARMLVRKHGIQVLVLDYLQLCAGNPRADKRHHQIEEISRGTKVLAKQLGITIILLSQLGREVERRTGGKPIMADLKESGSIEEDADVVILLSQLYARSSGARVIEAELAKNRQGRKGSVLLAFEGCYQRWTETIAEDKPLRPAVKHYTEDV